MMEDWSPAAPEVARDFETADHGRADEARRSYSEETVTAAQKEQLESQRAAPAHEEHLRPGGPGETEVHARVDTRNEGQLARVEDRLDSAHQEFARDFERSRSFDRDRDFDRNRGQGRER
jgi:hypothetical protein